MVDLVQGARIASMPNSMRRSIRRLIPERALSIVRDAREVAKTKSMSSDGPAASSPATEPNSPSTLQATTGSASAESVPSPAKDVASGAMKEPAPARVPKARKPDYVGGSTLFAQLQRGDSIADALEAETRKLLNEKRPGSAIAMSNGLSQGDETKRLLGHLSAGIIAAAQGYTALAWRSLQELPEELWVRNAAREFIRTGLLHEKDELLARVQALVAASPDWVPVRSWFTICSTVFGAQERELARQVFTILDKKVAERPDEWSQAQYRIEWLRPWIEPLPVSSSDTSPDRVNVAVLDYGHPDRHGASLNIGDPIQTLASLGHVVRHQGLTFHGEQNVVDLLERLQARVPEAFQSDTKADVEIVKIDRDASTLNAVPTDTWGLVFGWYMHPVFGMNYEFPLHPNLHPIIVSFHCNQQKMLTPEAITYLNAHGPIGCRDWTTVDVLLAAGVDAFFTGCITSTVCAVFPETVTQPSQGAGYIDMPKSSVPEGAQTFRQADDSMRTKTFVENIDYAAGLLEGYRDFTSITTSRLHCYMPSRSLGVNVNFRPPRPADMRFTGLIDIDDAAFNTMRSGLLDLIEPVMKLILAGESPDTVYSNWRELTAEKVATARSRHETRSNVPSAPDLDRLASAAANAGRDLGASTTEGAAPADSASPIALATRVQTGQEDQLAVLANSVVRHTTRKLAWTLLIDGEPSEALLNTTERFTHVQWTAIDVRAIGDTALLSLPDLLPHQERAVVLPPGAVVTEDVSNLWDMSLDDAPFAAPNAPGKYEGSGIAEVFNAAMRVGTAAGAGELRRDLLARQPQTLRAFRTDVMVINLATMRSMELSAVARAYARRYQLTATEALTLLAGSERRAIPAKWALIPTRSDEGWDEPSLIHFMDWPRPWEPAMARLQDLWLSERDLLKVE